MVVDGVNESFNKAEGVTAVIGVEALRCVVWPIPRGVSEDGTERVGAVMKSGRDKRPCVVRE